MWIYIRTSWNSLRNPMSKLSSFRRVGIDAAVCWFCIKSIFTSSFNVHRHFFRRFLYTSPLRNQPVLVFRETRSGNDSTPKYYGVCKHSCEHTSLRRKMPWAKSQFRDESCERVNKREAKSIEYFGGTRRIARRNVSRLSSASKSRVNSRELMRTMSYCN